MRVTPRTSAHGRFYLLLGLLLAAIFTRYALQIDIPRVLFLVLIALTAATATLDELVALMLCCIPLHECIDLFYSLGLCLMALVSKHHAKLRIGTSFLIVLLMVLWELLHCYRADFSLRDLLCSVIPLVMLMLVMFLDPRELDYPFLVRSFAWTTAGVCFYLLGKVFYAADFNIVTAVAGLQRLGVKAEAAELAIEGGDVNPNTLGIICVLAVTGLMQLRTMGTGSRRDYVLSICLIVFGALTASRTYLVCLLLMAVLLILAQKGGFARKARFLGIMVMILAVGLLLLWLLFPDLLSYYISRFLESDITTGRDDLLAAYHEFTISEPKVLLWGIGLQQYNHRLLEYFRVATVVPHNGIQEVVIAWGIPGLILFFGLFHTMLRRAKEFCSRPRLINYIPVLILLAKAQAGQLLLSSYTMLALSLAYLSLCQDFAAVRNGPKRVLFADLPPTGANRPADDKFQQEETKQ